jgi:hypothetical protein
MHKPATTAVGSSHDIHERLSQRLVALLQLRDAVIEAQPPMVVPVFIVKLISHVSIVSIDD